MSAKFPRGGANPFSAIRLIWLISLPEYAINVSQMHIYQNTFSNGSGWGKEIILWLFEQNESDIKPNFVLNNLTNMRKISSNSFLILGSLHFTSDNGRFNFIVMFS